MFVCCSLSLLQSGIPLSVFQSVPNRRMNTQRINVPSFEASEERVELEKKRAAGSRNEYDDPLDRRLQASADAFQPGNECAQISLFISHQGLDAHRGPMLA